MDENKGDFQGNLVRSIRQGGGIKSTLSGKSTPRGSPTYRRLHSGRTPRRESRIGGGGFQCFRSNRLVYWLLLITLWTYLGFYVQSRWAHGDNGDSFLGFRRKQSVQKSISEESQRRTLVAGNNSKEVENGTYRGQITDNKRMDVVLAQKGSASSKPKVTSKRKSRRRARSLHSRAQAKQKTPVYLLNDDVDEQELEIPAKNTTYGLLVGPFSSMEDRILGWSPEKRSGTCDRKGDFARLVWSRKFLLIFHELSMTGAPLSMMELATELLSCGATVKVVVLSKRGGLMSELARRRIRVLEDKREASFKSAMKVDLVIAGSAVCASWIEQYFNYHPAGASQIAWWIMENRREYFDRAKVVLNRVKMLIFLSEEQSKQWLTWCEEEKIKLRSMPALVPLSVNDEMAFVAGFPCTLNTPTFTTEKMLEKRQWLREAVRKEMGLTDNDMLVLSLSSINPAKGQLLLLEAARLVFEQGQSVSKSSIKSKMVKGLSKVASRLKSRSLLYEKIAVPSEPQGGVLQLPSLSKIFNDIDDKSLSYSHTRKALATAEKAQKQTLKVLIGSVGSKSNKLDYVKGLLSFLSEHSNMSKSVLWTPATIRVASLYSAADAYVINSQGLGETFGRVTIEAMAFSLPVLGTESGGTREIVDQNSTGLLHPIGRPGIPALAQNLKFLLKNPSLRKQMGMAGRGKVEKMYLKRYMYKRFIEVLTNCMKPS